MDLPKDLQKQVDEADEIYRQVYGDAEQVGDKPDEPETPPEGTPDTPIAEQVVEPEVKPPDTDSIWQQKLDDVQRQLEAVQHKYDTLKGKEYAEVPRLNAELSQALARIAALEADQKTKAPPEEVDESEQRLNEEFPELAKLFTDVLANKLKPYQEQIAKMTPKITGVEEKATRLERVAVETAEDSYLKQLDDLTPGWREAKDEPGFMDFLKEDIYGVTRYELAKRADSQLNAQATAKVYLEYMEKTGRSPKKPDEVKPVPASDPREEFLAPPASRGAETPTPKKDSITRQEIAQFRDDMSRGKYRDRPQAMEAMMAKIDKAISAGLVT